MQKIIYILMLVILPFFSFSQEEEVYYYEDDFAIEAPEMNKYKNTEPESGKRRSFLKEDNFDFRFTTGTSYANMFGNNLFSTYVMPEVRYKFNNKFSLSGGVVASLNYFPNFTYPGAESGIPMNNKMYSYYIFAKGEYQVNDKLRFRAATFFDVGNQSYNSGQFSFNNIGVDFKIAERAYISADISIIKSNSPFATFYSPFGGYFDNFHTSPIGNSMSFSFDRSGW